MTIPRIPALTICQPHAWAVMEGIKLYENRTWKSDYHGPLLIHAGMSTAWLKDFDMYPGCPQYRCSDMRLGAILGVVEMRGSKRPTPADGPYFGFGPWCHVYLFPRKFRHPVDCGGKQGVWYPNERLMKAVMDQMPELAEVPS